MATIPNMRLEPRPLVVAGIAVSGVLASGFLGATTNAVNGWVSPEYFVTVMRWERIEDVWRASIAQGMFEGLLFGIFFSLLFTVATGIITGSACSFGFAFKHLVSVLGGVYICWTFGGLAGVGLASLSPEFYQRTFFGVPAEPGAMLRYAWVGGSIWGAELGGFVSVVVGLVVLRANWRRDRGNAAVASGANMQWPSGADQVRQPTAQAKNGSTSHNVVPE